MNFTDDWSERRSMPFEIEPIRSAPSSALQTLPRPPKRLVPATTGPAIASSRTSPAPDDWLTASSRDAAMIPPIAARVDASMNTTTRTWVTRMPARRAASAFPPTAYMCRPKVVLVVMYWNRRTAPTRMSAASGRPRSAFRIAIAAMTAAERERRVRADREHRHDPAERVAVEDVGETGDLRIGEVDRARVAEHLE